KGAIPESSSMVFPAVQNPPAELADNVLELVQAVAAESPGVAVKFSFAFPFSRVAARGVCLRVLGQFGLSTDLKQSARHGLDPYYFRVTTTISRNTLPPEFYNFPTFQHAVDGLVGLEGVDVVETLRFLRVVFLHEALGSTFDFDDEGWRDRLDTAVEVDETIRPKIQNVLRTWTTDRHAGLEKYFEFLRLGLSSSHDEQI